MKLIAVRYSIVCNLLLIFQTCFTQTLEYTKLFDDSKVSSIYIYLDPDSLEEIYDNLENEYEHTALFLFYDGLSFDTVENIGFRLRGNTSLSSAKKSFKVSFNTYAPGRKYEGVEKLNLLGMHNDPTMVREKLYFDTYNAMGLPVRRSNFVRVYINDDYYGLYTNMEEIDEVFVKKRFGDNSGNLFKCTWPAQLDWRGANASAYQDNGYELQTNEEVNNWNDFINLVDVINNTSDADFVCALEEVFDVQQFLWIYALDISAGHWDNYAGNINNFYLYHNQITGKFEFLSFDCDNTFGVDWLGFDWTEQDLYNWPTGWYDVPLAARVLEVEEYRNQFSTYLKKISELFLKETAVTEKVLTWRDLIADAAAEDLYRTYDWGYNFDDFWNGFTTNDIDGHTPYGITKFVERRNLFTSMQMELYAMPPVVSEITVSPLLPAPNNLFTINAKITDDTEVDFANALVFYNSGPLLTFPMSDDGTVNDGIADDGMYGVQLNLPAGTEIIEIQIESMDIDGNYSMYPNCNTYTIPLNQNVPAIHINEILAENNFTIQDDAGNYSDYIEIFNYGNFDVDLSGYYLSDNPEDVTKWRFPETQLKTNTYLLLWADGVNEKSNYHLNFQLNNAGEFVGLYAPANKYFAIVDSITFPKTGADISFGRLPNGIGDFATLAFTSPGYSNDAENYEPPPTLETPYLTNNPSHSMSTLYFDADGTSRMEIIMADITGRKIQSIYSGLPDAGLQEITINTQPFSSGIYFLQIRTSTYEDVLPFVKL